MATPMKTVFITIQQRARPTVEDEPYIHTVKADMPADRPSTVEAVNQYAVDFYNDVYGPGSGVYPKEDEIWDIIFWRDVLAVYDGQG